MVLKNTAHNHTAKCSQLQDLRDILYSLYYTQLLDYYAVQPKWKYQDISKLSIKLLIQRP